METQIAQEMESLVPGYKESLREAKEAEARLSQAASLESPLMLGKYWQLLHQLFDPADGGAAPEFLLLKGIQIGSAMSYGRPSLHDATQTATLAERLQRYRVDEPKPDGDTGVQRPAMAYRVQDSAEEMPDEDAEGGKDSMRELMFSRLRDYVLKVAEQGGGLLVWLV